MLMKMTAHELAMKTVKDIEKRRYMRELGKKNAQGHSIDNMLKVQKRLNKRWQGDIYEQSCFDWKIN